MENLHRPAPEDAGSGAGPGSSRQPPCSATVPSPGQPFTFRSQPPRQHQDGQLPGLWQSRVSPVRPVPLKPPAPMVTSPLHPRPALPQGRSAPRPLCQLPTQLTPQRWKTRPLAWDLRVPLTLQLSQDAKVMGGGGEPACHGRARRARTHQQRCLQQGRAGQPAGLWAASSPSCSLCDSGLVVLPPRKPSCGAARGCREPGGAILGVCCSSGTLGSR